METIIIILTIFFASNFIYSQTDKQIDTNLTDEILTEYLNTNYLSPEDYIIKKFYTHEIIFIGEFHRIKEDVVFIQNIIPLLYKNDIYYLATEFARKDDQELIDSLINYPVYNQELAEKIMLLQYVYWGYKEYGDIFKSAWALNQTIPEGKRKFRIIGINNPQNQNAKEKEWAQVIMDEIISKNEKALVYCGSHHSFTEYLLPIYNFEKKIFYRFEDDRVGRYIFNWIGKKTITIFLHSPWNSDGKTDVKYVQPVDGKIEQIISLLPIERQRIGFDVKDSPFGRLKSTNSLYKIGYSDFTLGDFCDGYIYQKPIKELNGISVIENFINEKNLQLARTVSKNEDSTTVEEFMKGVKAFTDLKSRFKDVK